MARVLAIGILFTFLPVGCSPAANNTWLEPVSVSDFEASYSQIQGNPNVSDDRKIEAAISCYLEAKARGYSSGQPVDLAFLVDRTTAAGQSLYEYEVGRQTYTLVCWRSTGVTPTGCQYGFSVDEIRFAENAATCEARVSGTTTFAHSPDPFVFESEKHTFELTRGSDGFWRITDDSYRDEFRDAYPPGTDFRALADSFPARYGAWLKAQSGAPDEGHSSLSVFIAGGISIVVLLAAAVWLYRRGRLSRKRQC